MSNNDDDLDEILRRAAAEWATHLVHREDRKRFKAMELAQLEATRDLLRPLWVDGGVAASRITKRAEELGLDLPSRPAMFRWQREDREAAETEKGDTSE